MCAGDLPDGGNGVDGLGVVFYQPAYPCLFQNSLVDGVWTNVVSATASPSVVHVGEDGIADITLSFSGGFSRGYSSVFTPRARTR